ncbi:hypothetical protein QWY75_02195 [Pontixanthobacter aestiaquae]|uniref:Uncharacterized protein n=1 Tax=Pontixanthobacter aestiaquae TaxID=1509367 RepID=A0A844Z9W0_9SPHN|nr:hypothetical protein [Pontixanthobacter aestiaquae]MDN3645013.1 hypothetical protein [Pontixanthobacter aestiaquae]MXO83986.1 hypothetical protein [Pontixanthobacter aestiaquae]
MKIFKALFYNVAGYASMLGLYLVVVPVSDDRPAWHWVLIVGFGLFSLFCAYDDFSKFRNEKHTTYSTKEKINKFMKKWIENEGRTVVFSRDLSWGDAYSIKSTLMKKAAAGDLKLFVQKNTALSDELEKNGAEVVVYGATTHSPASRFTIVGHGKEGARVAVGTKRKGKHVVYEFESGDDPVFAIADDLTKMIASFAGKI